MTLAYDEVWVREPRLMVPRGQPLGPVRLQMNPLKFKAFVIFNGTKAVDVVSGITLQPKSAALPRAVRDGYGMLSDSGVAASGINQTCPAQFKPTGAFTLFWHGVMHGDHAAGGFNFPMLVAILYGNGSGTPYVVGNIRRTGQSTPDTVYIDGNFGGTYFSNTVNISLSGYYGQSLTISHTLNPGVAEPIYMNGVASNTSTAGGSGAPSTSAADLLCVGVAHDNDKGMNGTTLCAGVADKAWTAVEHSEWARDPYRDIITA